LVDATDELRGDRPRFDVVVVGAGFSGMYALFTLRAMGLSVRVFEQGAGVGGTWYWNRYPGARCDAESLEYCYSFSEELQQEWEWSERYAQQPEILRYLNHVADRFDLRREIQLNTTITSVHYDEELSCWEVAADSGERVTARYVIMASGALSARNEPPFPGLGEFSGRWYQTSAWPHERVDVSGLGVGVVGTGSTAIQAIPILAEAAEQLFVFQRTPNFSVPARNRGLSPEHVAHFKHRYAEHRASARYSRQGTSAVRDFEEPGFGLPPAPNPKSALEVSDAERRAEYERRWRFGGAPEMLSAYSDLVKDESANETVAEFVREKIRATVDDPRVAELLCPRDHPLGTKRICVDTNYYETYNRPNVTLVDARSAPIQEITAKGIRTTQQTYELDVIVFAIGFDALTGSLTRVDITGPSGRTLRSEWTDGPRTYLGLAVSGFPNLFIVTGPGSPSVLSNMVTSIEQHVDWIAGIIRHAQERGIDRVEATQDAQNQWSDHVRAVADSTLYPRANSWAMGANVPGKPRAFLPYAGGVGAYREICDEIAADGFRGFAFRGGRVDADDSVAGGVSSTS
jgi:cation diffusion facilitator CzcD-associated flavoprotein CzcO